MRGISCRRDAWVRFSKRFSGVPNRPFCTNSKPTASTTNNNLKSDGSPMSSYNAYRDIDKLDFMTAAKILFTTPPDKKKFGYDDETADFDDGIRTNKRELLEANMIQHLQPAYGYMLEQMIRHFSNKFEEEFGEALTRGEELHVAARNCIKSIMSQFENACKDAGIELANWDSSKEKLRNDLYEYVIKVQKSELDEEAKTQARREMWLQVLRFAGVVLGAASSITISVVTGVPLPLHLS